MESNTAQPGTEETRAPKSMLDELLAGSMAAQALPATPPPMPAGVTAAQVAAWKQKYGRLHWITADFEGKQVAAIAKRPGIREISAASSLVSKDPIAAGMVLFDNCILQADPEINANDELKLSVVKQLGQLFKNYETQLGEY